jgi:hypothetical protein
VLRIPELNLRFLQRLVGGCWICAALACAPLTFAAQEASEQPYAQWPTAAHRVLGELVTLAGSLVERAASARAAASQYRIDTVYFRETLRDLMLANTGRPPAEQLPAAFLTDMVRMAAVLDAAAECQSGRYIVCPADLMERLGRQHARIDDGLRRLTGKS